jgi:hypothetical protein
MAKTWNGIKVNMSTAVDRLKDFRFDSIWDGQNDSKLVKHKGRDIEAWRNAYNEFRSLLMKHYTQRYNENKGLKGMVNQSWIPGTPPRITRPMLKMLNDDFIALFTALVNREEPMQSQHNTPQITGLTSLLQSWDSNSYEQISLRYGLPRLPAMAQGSKHPDYNKKLNDDKVRLYLMASYDDSSDSSNALLKSFQDHELAFGTKKTIEESINARIGRWILIYAVLQTLSKVMVEPTLYYSEGVDYFLCAEENNEELRGRRLGQEKYYTFTAPQNHWKEERR